MSVNLQRRKKKHLALSADFLLSLSPSVSLDKNIEWSGLREVVERPNFFPSCIFFPGYGIPSKMFLEKKGKEKAVLASKEREEENNFSLPFSSCNKLLFLFSFRSRVRDSSFQLHFCMKIMDFVKHATTIVPSQRRRARETLRALVNSQILAWGCTQGSSGKKPSRPCFVNYFGSLFTMKTSLFPLQWTSW